MKSMGEPSQLTDMLSTPSDDGLGPFLSSPRERANASFTQTTPASGHDQTTEKVECLRMTVGNENLLCIRGLSTDQAEEFPPAPLGERNRAPTRIPEVTPRPFSMPRQSLLLDHLAALPCLLAGEFFLACEAGKAAQGPGVYRALKFLHFSELPAEIRVAKGIAKMDQAGLQQQYLKLYV